jgi:hypothetical protein
MFTIASAVAARQRINIDTKPGFDDVAGVNPGESG